MQGTGTEKASRGKGLGLALALVAGCSYGVGGSVSQLAVGADFTVPQVVFAQFIAGTVILGILVVAKFHDSIPRSDALKLLVLGLVSAISSVCYYLAIDLLSVSAGVAMQFQYVWIVVVIQAIFERRLPHKWTVISAVLVIVGTVFGSGLADEIAAGGLTMDPLGLFYALVCAVFYAIFIYFNGRVGVDYHPVTRSFLEVVGGLVLSVIVIVASGGLVFDYVGAIPWGIVMGLLMSIIPVLAIISASSRISGGLVAILTSSELPMAVLSGFLILGQQITPFIVFGVVVILAAIVLPQLDNRSAKAEAAKA